MTVTDLRSLALQFAVLNRFPYSPDKDRNRWKGI